MGWQYCCSEISSMGWQYCYGSPGTSPMLTGWLYVNGNWSWGVVLTWHAERIYHVDSWVCLLWQWNGDDWTACRLFDTLDMHGQVRDWMIHPRVWWGHLDCHGLFAVDGLFAVVLKQNKHIVQKHNWFNTIILFVIPQTVLAHAGFLLILYSN